MINKDYMLRIVERLGRELSILLGLRQRNQSEEALISIDELLLNTTGFTSRFINSLSEATLLNALTPLGILNAGTALWIAALLKYEGEVYEDLHQESEVYYRFVKALHLYLALLLQEPGMTDTDASDQVQTLLTKLADYDLPTSTQKLLFSYYEYSGNYAKAEDTLFNLLEVTPSDQPLRTLGLAFYQRLQHKDSQDLSEGNFSLEEVEEGLTTLQKN
jgi:Family of unknown function (DUF6483)